MHKFTGPNILRHLICSLLTILCIVALPGSSWARDWKIDHDKSRLTFVSDQFGTGFTGEITAYNAQVFFDPDDLPATEVMVEIDVTGITTGDTQRDASIRGLEWFAMEEFPKAQFVANGARHVEENRYALDGSLTIKGISRDLTLEFDFAVENDLARVAGDMVVPRNEFNIGEGQFSAAGVSAPDVKVHIDLVATPKE